MDDSNMEGSDEIKHAERVTYDKKDADQRPEYEEMWDSDDMHFLLDIGAESDFWSLLHDQTTGKVLDIGCGSGEFIQNLKDRHPDREVYGVDISEKQLEQGMNDNRSRGRLILSDAERLPFADATFDAVVMKAALHHMPNWQGEMLREIKRVLTPDGAFLFFEPGKYNPPAVIRRHLFPSSSHTPDEHPFDPEELRETLKVEFSNVEMSNHYFVSNMIPVFNNKSPVRIPQWMINQVYELEQRLPLSKVSWLYVGKATR